MEKEWWLCYTLVYGGDTDYDLHMTSEKIIKKLANCLLTGEDISPHTPTGIANSAGGKSSHNSFKEVEADDSLSNVTPLNGNYPREEKIIQLSNGLQCNNYAPAACSGAEEHFNFLINSSLNHSSIMDNSENLNNDFQPG